MFKVATISAPASSIRATMVASLAATCPFSTDEPPLAGIPATHTLSFTPTRLPLSGPLAAPLTLHRVTIAFSGSSLGDGRTPALRSR